MKKLSRKQIRKTERTRRKEAERRAAGIITPEEAHAAQDRRRADLISVDGLLRFAASEWSEAAFNQPNDLLKLYRARG